ncbi:hypothetical protein AVEN_175921-1 [Araneus ventricosus]|uniref:Tc1-like transposase DDE domain-containing protein n=1 Tax=Araneus ventricosus TaxID=182803 RepID=A0A4Y2JLN5_ARAVE|nr:hypothetical protein AVEN_175921-1 [Araneus ventricosus]
MSKIWLFQMYACHFQCLAMSLENDTFTEICYLLNCDHKSFGVIGRRGIKTLSLLPISVITVAFTTFVPRLYPNGDAVYNQDSAPSHTSRVTKKFLTDQQMLFLEPQQWMLNSPNAAPCDYFLCGHLKNKLNKRRVSMLRDL